MLSAGTYQDAIKKFVTLHQLSSFHPEQMVIVLAKSLSKYCCTVLRKVIKFVLI